MRVLGHEADEEGSAYFAGGATAVLLGWRTSTIDVDVSFVPENDRVLRALPRIKEKLAINVELASPADFIPVPAGWEERRALCGWPLVAFAIRGREDREVDRRFLDGKRG